MNNDRRVHQSKVLRELIEDLQAKYFAEIGVWKGTTVKQVLRKCKHVLIEYWAIDPWLRMPPGHGRMHRRPQEGWDLLYEAVIGLKEYFPQLHVLRTTSEKAAKQFRSGYFDLVFIDGMHDFENVLFDIRTWYPLVRDGGILSGHDFCPERPDVEKAVRQEFGDDFEVHEATVWLHKKGVEHVNRLEDRDLGSGNGKNTSSF